MASHVLERPSPERPSQSSSTVARVLHVINGEHYAGAERVQDLLALQLPRQGFDVTFAAIKDGKFAALRRSQDTPLVTTAMRGRFDLRPARHLAKLVRDGGFELIHTHTPRTALVGRLAARLAGVPMVYHLHSPTAADTTSRVRNWVNAASEKISLSGVAAVIAVSRSLGEYAVARHIDRSLVFVVPNGVPVVGPLAKRQPPSGTWTLGTVALFRPRKGLEVLIDALAQLRGQQIPVRLRAVGTFETPEYEAAIKAQVAAAGVGDLIEWRGFQSDVNAELAQMDLFVLPSLFGEGLPMVVLEAMAAGVPIVGTRVEGVPEAVRDGQDGLIAEPGDSVSLAQCIRQLVRGEADWSALRQSAHRRQGDRFSDASMADGVANVYRRVLRF